MVNMGYNNQRKSKGGYRRNNPVFENGMEDMAFERLKDLQRERENSREAGRAGVAWLSLFTEPLLQLVEGLAFSSTLTRNARERRV